MIFTFSRFNGYMWSQNPPTPASPSLWYKTQHNKKLESRTVKDLKWKHNFLEDLTDDQSQTFII